MTKLARVMVIDDDDLVRQTIVEVVAMFGYEVTGASNGRDALALLAEGSIPDVVVTDILMPGMSGLEVIAEIRRNFPAVRIVAMSGGGGTRAVDNLSAARESGADAILPKPVDLKELKNILKSLVAPE